MAEALVKFSLQRLNSLQLHESHNFLGLEDQTHSLKAILDEIGQLFEPADRMTRKNYEFKSTLFRELRDIVHNMENCIDDFIIQMENKNGSDQMLLIDHYRNELEKIEESLVQIKERVSEDDKKTAIEDESKDVKESSSKVDEGEASSSSTSSTIHFSNLPYYIQSCFMYCCIFPENYAISKGRLVRLLVAEGLVQENPTEIMEDIAEKNIETLSNLGLLQVVNGSKLKVPGQIREMMLGMLKQEEFVMACTSTDTNIPHTTRRISIHSDTKNIPTNLNNLPLRSLFMFGIKGLSEAELDCLRPVFHGKKFLRVLDLEDIHIKNLPNELGDLIHLRYLGLKKSNINELPQSVCNLRNLQTLDIRWNGKLASLSSGILNLLQLRHLKMFKNSGICGVLVPVGIGGLKNLLTLTGLHVGDGIAAELGNITQLQRLGVMDLEENVVNELCASIMKMKGLLSLSLEAKFCYPHGILPSVEPFLPPPLLQKLRLEGRLEKIPNWFSLLGNLSKLRLGFSHLSEDPALVLQFLPNLKHLTLWQAYDAKQIGKEFCGVGGFPKLEVLVIASHVLEEWTELEEGAFPSLKYLNMHNCLNLRMLPEGLQHVTTLQELKLLPLLDDHAERLKPEEGEENYKIKHIPLISFITTSMVQQIGKRAPNLCGRPPASNVGSA